MNELSYHKEKENKTVAFFISLLIYLTFFALLYFLKIMYQKPEEPTGVELNYGIDLVGSGDIQTTNLANSSPNNYDVKPANEKKEETKAVKPVKAVTPPPVVDKTEKVKTKVKVVPEKPILTTKDDEAKIEAKEKVKKVETKLVKTQPVKTPPIEETKPTKVVAKPTPPSPEPPKKVEPKVDNGSIFKKGGTSTTSGSNGTIGTRDGVGGNNNGDGKKGQVGDQGDARGTLDGKSMYGNPGKGGTGTSISGLQGWTKKKLSIPKDNSDETGKIVFRVTVDDSGDVVGINVIESNVSPSVVNFYKNYLQNKLGDFLTPEGTPPPRATGTITINIQSGN